MTVHIPRVRRCLRCSEPAIRQTGRDLVGKLCPLHLQERRHRQARTAAQPNCRCGNKMPLGATQCRGCDWKDDEAQRATMRRREQLAADLGYIAQTDPQAIEDAFNSLMRGQIRSLQRDYP